MSGGGKRIPQQAGAAQHNQSLEGEPARCQQGYGACQASHDAMLFAEILSARKDPIIGTGSARVNSACMPAR